MAVRLIIIGRKTLWSREFDFDRLSVLLADKDCIVDKIFFFDDEEEIILPTSDEKNISLICGNVDKWISSNPELPETDNGIYVLGNDTFVTFSSYDEQRVRNVVLPLLTKDRVQYNTVIIKTFGKSKDELREILKEVMKCRHKIDFLFYEKSNECELRLRYSKSVPSTIINDVVSKVGELLSDCIYALKEVSLAKSVARALLASGKRLAIAESFTGGGIASALVALPGMSSALIESIVCYSNESKISRLGVPSKVISFNGAVSADTAFEMASGLLATSGCDIAVATTGNAGPTAEKDGQVGLFYVAIGDKNAIHVFAQYHEVKNSDKKSVDDIRKEITDAGISTALFELGKYLKSI
ncbi:MAG: CinA family protein [Clostridia bacterium]|nr:CinA family protein [Clostridia bacterium]